jgi:hypothetical protein
VEDQPEYVEVGEQDLPEEPGYISTETNPGRKDSAGSQFRDEITREKGDDGAGDQAKGQMEEIEAAGKDDPENEEDQEENRAAATRARFLLKGEGACIPGFRGVMPVDGLILSLHGYLWGKGL